MLDPLLNASAFLFSMLALSYCVTKYSIIHDQNLYRPAHYFGLTILFGLLSVSLFITMILDFS